MEIDINGVKITLTKEQLNEIARQTKKEFNYRDITSFEDACNHLGISKKLPSFDELDIDEKRYHIALYKLVRIVRALNNGWIPNFNDTNQKKWYPWFNLKDGFTFCDTTYYWNVAGSIVGSRLCVKEDAIAKYLGEQFLNEFKDLLK